MGPPPPPLPKIGLPRCLEVYCKADTLVFVSFRLFILRLMSVSITRVPVAELRGIAASWGGMHPQDCCGVSLAKIGFIAMPRSLLQGGHAGIRIFSLLVLRLLSVSITRFARDLSSMPDTDTASLLQ